MDLHLNVPDRLAGFRPFSVPSAALEPMIDRGDFLMVDLRYYRTRKPQDANIVIFVRGNTYLYFVKRVLAVGGEAIEGGDNHVFLNGREIDEPHVLRTSRAPILPRRSEFGPVAVAEGKLFVAGDNRDVSYDRRQPEHGLADTGEIRGRPQYVIGSENSARYGLQLQ